jgi:SAM-dependent methyltransferase
VDAKQRKRIVDRHRDSLLRYGVGPAALYWSSREIQELRFSVLADIGLQSGDSVLDVGCGFGDLWAYLQGQGIEVDYTGIDLSPELVAAGREQYPDLKLMEGDIFDLNPAPASYDFVLLSGALNENLNDDGAYARRVIARMVEASRRGVALNLLNANHQWTAGRWNLQSFDPAEMLAYCQDLSSHCEYRDDYLDNDFSVFLHTEPLPAMKRKREIP